MKQFLRSREAAEYLGIAEQTLARWRWQGGKIPFSRMGRAVVYDIADLDAYAAVQRRGSTSDPGPWRDDRSPGGRAAYASDTAVAALERRVADLTQRVQAIEQFLERLRFSTTR